DSRLASEVVHAVVGFQPRIVVAEGVEGGLGELVRRRQILAQTDHHEGSAGTLQRDGPAGFVFLALQAPAFGVAEADSAVVKSHGHGPPPCLRGLRYLEYFIPRKERIPSFREGSGADATIGKPTWRAHGFERARLARARVARRRSSGRRARLEYALRRRLRRPLRLCSLALRWAARSGG